MKKLTMTYAELFDLMNESDKEYFVKTPSDELTKINACVQKESDTYDLTIGDYNITAGDKHCFKHSNGSEILAEDLVLGESILSTQGPLKVKSKTNFKQKQKVYDISIDSPHWYVNDEYGIIHHNTGFSLLMAKAYMNKYPDSVLLFYDTEFGTPKSYFDSFAIDQNRTIHTPVTDIEQLKFDIMNQLNELERGDRVFILIDSIGNIASKKEVEDAMNEKSVADMTRAKQMKSLFRMVTPHLNLKDIPMICVAHTYNCVDGEQNVKMSDGSIMNIKDIKSGMSVKTIGGDRLVTNTVKHDLNHYIEFEFEDGKVLKCTPNHKFMVNGEWVNAIDIEEGVSVDCI